LHAEDAFLLKVFVMSYFDLKYKQKLVEKSWCIWIHYQFSLRLGESIGLLLYYQYTKPLSLRRDSTYFLFFSWEVFFVTEICVFLFKLKPSSLMFPVHEFCHFETNFCTMKDVYTASGISIPPDFLFTIRKSYLDSPLFKTFA
jgi:hypothetical protein